MKWQILPESDNTWESLDVMKEQFPNFNLEDKVPPDEGGMLDIMPLGLHMLEGREVT